MITVYIVGRAVPEENTWELQGVYFDEIDALKTCFGHCDFWIGPIEMNKEFPARCMSWPGLYFPYLKPLPPEIVPNRDEIKKLLSFGRA